jgi:uncharacterized protein
VLLDLRDLSLRGGERHERTYSLDVAPVVLGGVDYEVLVPQGVTVTVARVTGGFLIDVSLDARVYGPCARCLREVALQVRAEQQEFAPTAKDGWEESDLSAFVEDMVVDIAGIAREALVLALPARVLCSQSCKGLCSQCGRDLNQNTCDCASIGADERWSKLKDLTLEEDRAP